MAKKMTRMLVLNGPGEDGNYLGGPAVLEAFEGKLAWRMGVSNLTLQPLDEIHPLCVFAASLLGDKIYPIRVAEDLRMHHDAGIMTFQSQDKVYTVRAFQDSDGTWASYYKIPLPAEALEAIYMNGADVNFSPEDPDAGENLFAGVDEDLGTIRALVYTYSGGMYTREGGEWVKTPDGDETLDGVTVYNVTPEFIKVWDEESANGDNLPAKLAEPFATEFSDEA